MTVAELIKQGKHKVRSNPDLMKTYVQLFSEKFGREPNCAGCTFDNDWNRLTEISPIAKIQVMSNTNFKLKDNTSIFSYQYKHENGRVMTARTYGYAMTQEFALEYLKNAKKDELEKRQSEFKILPSVADAPKQEPTAELTKKELQDLATKKGYKKSEWEKLNKTDLILYIESQV